MRLVSITQCNNTKCLDTPFGSSFHCTFSVRRILEQLRLHFIPNKILSSKIKLRDSCSCIAPEEEVKQEENEEEELIYKWVIYPTDTNFCIVGPKST